MIVNANALKGSYAAYQKKCLLGRLVEEIPLERRRQLAEEIKAQANLFGCKNKEVLEAALKKLRGGKKVETLET